MCVSAFPINLFVLPRRLDRIRKDNLQSGALWANLQLHQAEELMAKHVVARREEIPPGGRKIVRVAGREVGIFNLDGTFYALKNVCPHQGARVCLGRIVGTALPSAVYEYTYGREGEILRCPWHEWEYDIVTGESLFDPNIKIVSYPVEVVSDDIVVTIGQ